jgi:hypothetical protein
VEFDSYFPYFITNKHGQPLHLMLKGATVFPACRVCALVTYLGAATALGLPFVGRHHSGLDDCKTIVQIVQYLLKLGMFCPSLLLSFPAGWGSCVSVVNTDLLRAGHVFDQPTKIEKPFDPLEESWNKVPPPVGGRITAPPPHKHV